MEENACFLEHWLPAENQVVEIENCDPKVSFEDVFFEGVRFTYIYSVENYFQDGDENISSCVQKIER